MAQFPVTNAEWALFMQAGGYEEERWWETEEARAWRRGEGTAEGPKQQWRDDRKGFGTISTAFVNCSGRSYHVATSRGLGKLSPV